MTNYITSLFSDKPLEVSVSIISSRSLHITAQPPPGPEMVEVNCTLTAKETSSYIRTVSLDSTRDGGAQRLTDNLVPYTNYTATCLVFKDGVDQCYIGSDTAQTYTDSKLLLFPDMQVYTVHVFDRLFLNMYCPYLLILITCTMCNCTLGCKTTSCSTER